MGAVLGSQEPPPKTIIGEASLGSFIKVLVRTPPLTVSGIRSLKQFP